MDDATHGHGDSAMVIAAGPTVLTIGMWATSSLPEHMVAVIFFVLAVMSPLAFVMR